MKSRLDGREIYLRLVKVEDAAKMLAYYRSNRNFLAPWEPKWPEDFFTLEGQRQRLEGLERAVQNDQGYPFGIFLKHNNKLIGRVNLSSVGRGFFLSANLGYSMDWRYNGRGYMTEAVRLILGFAFEDLGLHRIQAATLTHNHGSMRVLEKTGFRREGTALRYLKINDQWQDHHIFAITAEEFNLNHR